MKQNPALPLFTASLAAIDLPAAGDVPEWVHLLPVATGPVRTFDGRGPYRVTDAAAVIAASFNTDARDEHGLIIDENHSSMLAAPVGLPSPSRGKILEMEARPDGVWGRIEWNAAGHALMADRSYRGISPVIVHDAQGRVVRIKNASLVNYPNLRGLTALHMETSMTFKAKLAEKLGLPDAASEDDILGAVSGAGASTALQSAMTNIGAVLGIDALNTTAIVTAVKGKLAAEASLTTLQAENTSLLAENATLKAAQTRKASEAAIDAGIAEMRSGLNAQNREDWITLHMSQPDLANQLIANMGKLGEIGHIAAAPQSEAQDDLSLNAEQQGETLAGRAKAYQAKLKAEGTNIEFTAAVRAVSEGKK